MQLFDHLLIPLPSFVIPFPLLFSLLFLLLRDLMFFSFVFTTIRNLYGFQDDTILDKLVIRGDREAPTSRSRQIYSVNEVIKSILRHNDPGVMKVLFSRIIKKKKKKKENKRGGKERA